MTELKYKRIRQEPPGHFISTSFKTVHIGHTTLKNKYRKKCTKAVVGKYKAKWKKIYKWGIQTVLRLE